MVAAVGLPTPARAADPDPAPVTPPKDEPPEGGGRPKAEPSQVPDVIELRHDLRIDLPITVGLIGSYATILLVRDELQPGRCRWCDGSSPSDLNAVDDWFRTAFKRSDPQPANVMSHVLAFGVGPLTLAGATVLAAHADNRTSEALVDILLATEGAFSAIVLTEVLKPLILRERPRYQAIEDPELQREALARDADTLRSFPSGHTTSVFAATAAAGMIASMRGYRLAPLVWASGILIGLATAYARIAADRHHFTDTLGGAAVGLLVGGAVPFLFHRPTNKPRPTWDARAVLERTSLTTTAVPGGRLVGVGLSF